MKRILIGGILAGIVLFVWSWIAHAVLPLGEMGIRTIADEDVVIPAMKEGIREAGLYFFPGLDMSREPSEAEYAAWEEKYEAGPTGFLVYRPQGEQPMSVGNLLTQFGVEVLSALLAAFLVSFTGVSFLKRVVFVTILGIFAWVHISLPYWNWYGFPTDFTLAQALDSIGGWFLAGLVLATIVKPTEG